MDQAKQQEAAAQLAAYLTDRSGYNRTSPLEEMVRTRISEMAREIAHEVIKATPGLRDEIHRRTTQLVSQALRDDAYLSGTITKAVGEALGHYVAQQRDDES